MAEQQVTAEGHAASEEQLMTGETTTVEEQPVTTTAETTTAQEQPLAEENPKVAQANRFSFFQLLSEWWRKAQGLFLALLDPLDRAYPAAPFPRLSGGVDHYGIHQALAVEQGLADPPRFEVMFWPTSCPKARPIERACGDVHDKCTRTHTRKRLRGLVGDVKRHLYANGPWQYERSEIYYTG